MEIFEMSQETFPRELLSQPLGVKLAYFESKIVAHPALAEAYTSLLHAIRYPAGASLIFVYGPTGVGKTTLRRRVEKQLIEEALPSMEKDLGLVPIVAMEAVSPGSGNFNWKDYYRRALSALNEPLIDYKIDYQARGIRRSADGRLIIPGSTSEADLRWALEQCMKYRKLTAFIIDEAQHFGKMASGRRLLDQMDALKSVAGMTGTVHVLVGTYGLQRLTNLSAQLSRRSVHLHFPRYRLDSNKDIDAFVRTLKTFQQNLPLADESDMSEDYEYFYEGCLGCIGVLKDWLCRALERALSYDRLTLSRKDLDLVALPSRERANMAREINEGEKDLIATKEEQDALCQLLDKRMAANQVTQTPTEQTQQQGRRVGERNPTRDPVGVPTHDR